MYDVVVPTLGRPSLARLLSSLATSEGPLPGNVWLVDDRRERSSPLAFDRTSELAARITVVPGAAAGPAAARNRGWGRSRAPWIAFLDDDVVVEPQWRRNLQFDLAACDPSTAASQGRVTVPLPAHRRPTDWERNVRGLEDSRWITADCAYRRQVLHDADGFDERFPRAFREDADLALRVVARGGKIALGSRRVEHPVRPADDWVSVRLQAGNADDALMRALHGSDWYERAGAPRGTFGRHVATVACALAAGGFASAWAMLTARFAFERIAPGPRDVREIRTMLGSSVAIPFAAVFHRARGQMRVRQTLARRARLPEAVLFDRDGTLIEDVPLLAGPGDVRLMPGARAALDRLRSAGIAVGIVTNQPRIGEGALDARALDRIHARLETLAGPFATIQVCGHARDAGCACRKPRAGLVLAAAEHLRIDPAACVVVGDIGADMDAARAAGARGVLVPTSVTLADEVDAAPFVARNLSQAVDLILESAAPR